MSCSHSEIANYLDGELAPNAEIIFERHLVVCEICAARLNEQKQVLLALNAAFSDENRFDLPVDFTKKIIVEAESDVSGLRERSERRRAVFLVSGLFATFVTILFFSRQSGILFAISDVALASGKFVVNFLYAFGLSVVVILRVVNHHFLFDSTVSAFLAIALLVCSLLALSHFLNRYHRV
ncbi:MAG: hypothetical protein H7Z37_18835 [Pyrinomonadaceae bacterium]|nr:hypothetical protein [Pyrinomonadaceae bacterium]